jgi:hypothetical protein
MSAKGPPAVAAVAGRALPSGLPAAAAPAAATGLATPAPAERPWPWLLLLPLLLLLMADPLASSPSV